MDTYTNDNTWVKMQPFLPPNNQLTHNILPEEYYVNLGSFQVHIDHYKCVAPKGRLILFHGVGGNGRLLSFIALPLNRAGYDIICPDLPLYGFTQYKGTVSYKDWVQVGIGLVDLYAKENTPLFVFGLSAGGMLAYQVACECVNVKAVMATCILDQRYPEITKATAVNPMMGRIGPFITNLLYKPFGKLKLPMKMVAKMKDIANNQQMAKLLMNDKKSSGASVSLAFLQGMLNPNITVEPEQFVQCPFLLVHPEDDRWTDISLSRLFFNRLSCEKEWYLLPGAGHFPIEQEGLLYLEKTCVTFLDKQVARICEEKNI